MDAKRLLNELCKNLEQELNKDKGSKWMEQNHWVSVGLKVYHRPLGNFKFSDMEYIAEIWIDSVIYIKESIVGKNTSDRLNMENTVTTKLLRKIFNSGVLGHCQRKHVKTWREHWQWIVLQIKRFYF